jgi:AraC-like DNA-binding protein
MPNENQILKYKGKVVFHKMKITSPKREMKPFQNNEACFMFINEGDFSVRTPNQFISFNSSKALLAKCFNFFIETTEQQRNVSKEMEFIGIFLFPDQVEEIMGIDLSKSNYKVPFNIKRIDIDSLFTAYRNSINVLLDNPEIADEDMIKLKLKEMVILIAKSQNLSVTDFLVSMFSLNHTEFKSIINNNIYSNLSILEFAKLCSMSLSSFKRKFDSVYAESPKKYINRLKLEKASTLLSSTNLLISEIAYECGFDTISSFNRTFKFQFKVSPTEFRLNQIA